MASKNNPCEFDCLANLEDDEEYFVLRANDELAPGLITAWAYMYAQTKGGLGNLTERQRRKYLDALQCAREMSAWKARRVIQIMDSAPVPETDIK